MASARKFDHGEPRVLPTAAPDGSAVQAQVLHRLKTQMVLSVAASYCLDALVLAAFVACDALSGWVPVCYLACGLTECAVAYHRVRGRRFRAWTDRYMTLPRMALACLLQLSFMLAAPAVSLYFTGVLFIVFAFGTLRLKARETAVLWLMVTLALSVMVAAGLNILQLPHATATQRLIAVIAAMLTLGRSAMIGLFSSHLRAELGCRYREVRSSLQVSEADRTRTSIALHEDLSQDIAGIAMTLAAYAARQRQRNPAEARDLEEASAQLRGVVEKARVLAFPIPARRASQRPDELNR